MDDPRHALSRRVMLMTGCAALGSSLLDAPAEAAPVAPEFVGIDGWLNSRALSMRGLRGRVVLVNFFARACVNCIATIPYIRGWHARYSGRGFTVVGVHTPELPAERSRQALEAAVQRFGLTYPVAIDNDSATWNAWGNRYWPAEYIVDQQGRIVYSHFGEGAYSQTEAVIQRLTAT
ncbi:redoxin family protein [Methylobacterium brachythecii]|nr:redoxin family protein [Methylobacterium brachythecii]MBB3904996.1 thiol-disulfide isomerase/thioredoxin [Methylobacterium brachythecii]